MKGFYLKFHDVSWMKKGTILMMNSNGMSAEVIKVYRDNWWRRLLLRIGFKVKINQVKVI